MKGRVRKKTKRRISHMLTTKIMDRRAKLSKWLDEIPNGDHVKKVLGLR